MVVRPMNPFVIPYNDEDHVDQLRTLYARAASDDGYQLVQETKTIRRHPDGVAAVEGAHLGVGKISSKKASAILPKSRFREQNRLQNRLRTASRIAYSDLPIQSQMKYATCNAYTHIPT